MSAATLTPADFAADFEARRERRLSEAVRSYPRNQPIASDVEPGSCLRRQVLEVTAWESKEPIPTHRQARFEAGIEAEAQAQAICMVTGDFRRAFEAFAEKRTPVFEGD